MFALKYCAGAGSSQNLAQNGAAVLLLFFCPPTIADGSNQIRLIIHYSLATCYLYMLLVHVDYLVVCIPDRLKINLFTPLSVLM